MASIFTSYELLFVVAMFQNRIDLCRCRGVVESALIDTTAMCMYKYGISLDNTTSRHVHLLFKRPRKGTQSR